MNYRQKPLYKRAALVAMAGCITFGACRGFPRCTPLENMQITDKADSSQLAVSTILACRNLTDLKIRLPGFSVHLEKIAKDAKALADLYEALRLHMIKIMDETRMQDNKGYVDDLVFLGRLFEEQKSRSARMAIVFLSLPRLFERAMVLPWDKGLLEVIKSHSESAFLLMLERDGFSDLAKAIRTYWYKSDGMLPTEKEVGRFFKIFSGLY